MKANEMQVREKNRTCSDLPDLRPGALGSAEFNRRPPLTCGPEDQPTSVISPFGMQLCGGLLESFKRLSNPIPFPYKLGVWGKFRSNLKKMLLSAARKRNLFWVERPERAFAELTYLTQHLDEFEQFHGDLADPESRDRLVEALKLRVLGPYYVQASIGGEGYRNAWEDLEDRSRVKRGTIRNPGYPRGDYFEFPHHGQVLRLHASTFGIMTTFVTEQYTYRASPIEIGAQAGDVVIDGGGYLGETALYFAQRVGAGGRVFCFEFNDWSLPLLKRNLQLNPELDRLVTVLPAALWSEAGQRIPYEGHGPGTSLARSAGRLAAATGSGGATTITIDDFVAQENLARLDFIKFDIEGAELAALKGAQATLQRFKPALAVSLYHKIEDFIEIPAFLNSLALGYRFYLKHAFLDRTETVLFAVARTESESGRNM